MCQGLQSHSTLTDICFPHPKALAPTLSASLRGSQEEALSKTVTGNLRRVQHCAWHVNTEMKQNLDCPGPWSLVRPQASTQAVPKQEVRAVRRCIGVRTAALTRRSFICSSTTVTQGEIQSHSLTTFFPTLHPTLD